MAESGFMDQEYRPIVYSTGASQPEPDIKEKLALLELALMDIQDALNQAHRHLDELQAEAE